ncbi:MAG: TolC family protein [Muribaculaceae bacterium]|nr:TolC family protein [Muribaculaceae bacterium]
MKRIIIAAAALFAAISAIADDFDEAARSIAEANTQVAASRARYEARLEEGRAANVLAGPEVEVDYKFAPSGAENRWGVSVGQSFDWPGVYASRRKANGYRADAFAQLYRSEFVEKALEAKQLLIAIAESQKQLELLRTASETMTRLAEAYETAFAQGETTMLEVSKIRLRRFEIENRLAKAEVEDEQLLNNLRVLNGGAGCPEVPELPLTAHLKSLDEYRKELENNDPGVAANRMLESAAMADVSTARRSGLPSFRLAYVHDYEEGFHFNGFSVGISLPSWGPRASVKAARAEAMAQIQDTGDYALRVNARLLNDYRLCARLDSRVDAARRLFVDDIYPAQLLKALDAGRITLFEYLSEYGSYLDAKSEYYALCGELAQACASLDRYALLPAF